MIIKKNSIWLIRTRGFNGIARFKETFDSKKDSFPVMIILSGRKNYISTNRYCEKAGDKISIRTGLTEFLVQIPKKVWDANKKELIKGDISVGEIKELVKCQKCGKGVAKTFVMGMGEVCGKCYDKNLKEVKSHL